MTHLSIMFAGLIGDRQQLEGMYKERKETICQPKISTPKLFQGHHLRSFIQINTFRW
jgi:hypothetical protein